MQTVILSLRQERRLTRQAMLDRLERRARELGESSFSLSERQLARIESGDVRTAPRPANCRVIEAEFGRPFFDLIADGRALNNGTPVLLSRREPLPGHERELPGDDSELVRKITAARQIDPELIGLLQNETEAIRVLDRRLGAPAVFAKLDAHISHVEESLRYSLRPGNRERLAAVLADASSLAGWQAIDMCRLSEAWTHFERATTAAREAGDPCLLAFSGGEQAYILLDLARPNDALAMIQEVYRETRSAIPSQLRGWLRAAEAEMAAASGLEYACRAALDQATHEISNGITDEHLPYIVLDEAHLARWRGNCLVHFGDPEIVQDLSDALVAIDGSFTRAQAGLHCDLAAVLHIQGELDQAKHHLGRAHELAQFSGSARQRRRIRESAARMGI